MALTRFYKMTFFYIYNQYMLAAETVITNEACAAAAFIFVIVIYVHYFRLLSKTFDLWRQFYIIVNHATRDFSQ